MKSICYISITIFICSFLSTGVTQAATVDYQPPKLSISASNEPLISVLRAIAREMDISISYASNIDKTVTCRIAKLPVQRAFKNLLGNSNFALQWEDKRVVGLTILQKGAASSPTTTISAENEYSDNPEDPQLEREIANEIARTEKETEAEIVRMDQEMIPAEH